MTGERIVDNDAYIIAGIKSIVKAQNPKFEDVKERVIAEVKAEKRAAAVEEQLKKEGWYSDSEFFEVVIQTFLEGIEKMLKEWKLG